MSKKPASFYLTETTTKTTNREHTLHAQVPQLQTIEDAERGADDRKQRNFHIKNITEKNIVFARALMKKAYEIAEEREVPITLFFYDTRGEKHNELSTGWEPFQKKVNEFCEMKTLILTGGNIKPVSTFLLVILAPNRWALNTGPYPRSQSTNLHDILDDHCPLLICLLMLLGSSYRSKNDFYMTLPM
jgi:hypothetical protein